MKEYLKFLKKLNPKLRRKILDIVLKISENNFDNLDIKKLSSHKNLYRVRIGNVRIIFQKLQTENIIYNISFRKDAY